LDEGGKRLTLMIGSVGCGGAERVLSILSGAGAEQEYQVTLLAFDRDPSHAYALHPAIVLRNLNLTSTRKNLSTDCYEI
jgi:hypothetical protein